MKTLATISIIAISIALSGCQMFSQQSSQQAVEEPAPLPIVSTGTCVFGSKSGKQTITTTHTDCALRGGNFLGGAPAYGGVSSVPVSGSGVRVETL